jgi:hypothetical protein
VDTLKDIWASMVAGVQERTTNPLTFSFIASWCLWNFKFFVILTGDGTTAERLHAVDDLYRIDWQTYLGHAFGAPLLTAVFYVFLYPHISAKVIDQYRRKQVAIANSVREIEGARLMTIEESRRQIRNHELERAAWQENESKLQTQLHEAREALQAAERQINEKNRKVQRRSDKSSDEYSGTFTTHSTQANVPSKSHSDLPISLDRDTVRILLHISTYSTSVSLDVIASNLKMNSTVAKAELADLENAGFLSRDDAGFWELSDKGAKLAVKLIKDGEHTDL